MVGFTVILHPSKCLLGLRPAVIKSMSLLNSRWATEQRPWFLPAHLQERAEAVAIWTIFLLISGQGVRYLVGVPGFLLLAGLTLVAVIRAFPIPTERLRPPVLIGVFVGVALLTTLWSTTPVLTLTAAGTLLATAIAALVIVRGTEPAQFFRLLYRGFQCSMFVGVGFEVFVTVVLRRPVLQLEQWSISLLGGSYPDPWSENLLLQGGPIQGFVGNRNPFGMIALLTVVGAVVLYLERRITRADALTTGLTGVGVILLTDSATVTVTATYLIGLFVAALVLRALPSRWTRAASVGMLVGTAVLAMLTLKYREAIFTLLERTPDATHRTEIWAAMILAAAQRPEGWGYVGFWPPQAEPYASIITRAAVGHVPPHGHNSYLDAWLQLGILGAAVLVAIVALTYLGSWRLVERSRTGHSLIPLGWALLAAALAIQGLTESRLLSEWGVFLLVALYCSVPGAFTLTLVGEERVTGEDDARPDLQRP